MAETRIVKIGDNDKFSFHYIEGKERNYKIFRHGKDVTKKYSNNLVSKMFYDIIKLISCTNEISSTLQEELTLSNRVKEEMCTILNKDMETINTLLEELEELKEANEKLEAENKSLEVAISSARENLQDANEVIEILKPNEQGSDC